jgi:predicted small integral membrane protein
MSKETRKDFVLVIITSIASAIGMTSVFVACRPLAWIAIVISDAYLAVVLLFAAILSDDRTFANRHPWITGFFPRRTAALFVTALLLLSIVSGFAGLYVGTDVFPSWKTRGDALYISLFTLAFTDYSPKPGYGQLVVVGQVASGILYLIAAVPLLISRIATFASP